MAGDSRAVLFVDSDPHVLRAAEQVFDGREDVEVLVAADARAALRRLDGRKVDLVVAAPLDGTEAGTSLHDQLRRADPEMRVGVLHPGDTSDADLRREFGDDVLVVAKPWEDEALRSEVLKVVGRLSDAIDQTDPFVKYAGLTQKQIDFARRVGERMEGNLNVGQILLQLGEITQEDFDRVHALRRADMSVAELLYEDDYLSEQQLAEYWTAKEDRPDADEFALLVEPEIVSEEAVLRTLAERHGIEYREPDMRQIDRKLYENVSIRYLVGLVALPVAVEDDRLQVILARPLDAALRSNLERTFFKQLDVSCCTSEKVLEALRTIESIKSGNRTQTAGGLNYRKIGEETIDDESTEKVVQIVDYLLMRAIELGASDLHLEPMKDRMRVRARIDGELRPLTELPPDVMTRVVSRIKILGSCDISERRLHQDGKIFVEADGSEVDIRVSTYVSVYGECIVMRLLNRSRGLLSLQQIDFTPRVTSLLDDVVLPAASGMILISGPTGSGKTTTMYSLVEHSRKESEKVISAEDPVEYVLEGAIQCTTNRKTGPTFADSLRAMMRQDPDTIVVGEIRDHETASLGIECSLTGHKVFSTFHTENSVTVLIRLLEMGIEPFLVSSTITSIIAQRLVRRTCSACAEEQRPRREELRYLGLSRNDLDGVALVEGRGCPKCEDSGYRGRVGIHEVLILDDELREAVLRRAPARELAQLARRTPQFLTLQEDALLKVGDGKTTLAEICGKIPRDVQCRSLGDVRAIAGARKKP